MKISPLFVGLLITLAMFVVLSGLTYLPALAEPTNFTFYVNLTLTGNAVPSITYVQPGLTANPLESQTRTVYIAFNASDDNGYTDINMSSAIMVLTLAGEQQRTSTTCTNYYNESLTAWFNCSVNLYYYDLNGDWTIDAKVYDLAGGMAENNSITFNYGSLQAMRATPAGITFGNVNLGDTAQATNDPLVLNNTGNQNFTKVNITAYNLVGQLNANQYIPATDLYVNATANSLGSALGNNTETQVIGAFVPRDIGGSAADQNVYFWVDVPSAGLSNQDYISSSPWLVEVFP